MADATPAAGAAARVKATGRHFTPPRLARFLARLALAARPEAGPLEVLDPACGDGGLLAALVDESSAARLLRLRCHGIELDGSSLDVARTRLSGRLSGLRLERADFLDRVLGQGPAHLAGRFDLVIANPPYVRTQVLGADRARQLARDLGLAGRVDLQHAFVRGMTLALRPGGVLALLCSNRFLFTQAGASVRHILATQYRIEHLVDLGDTRLFAAAVLPVVLIARRAAREPGTATRCTRVYSLREPAAGAPSGCVLDAVESGRTGPIRVGRRTFAIEHGELLAAADAGVPWILAPAGRRRWLERIHERTVVTFGDVAHIRVGVKTTADSVFVRADWDSLPAAIRPEAALLRPLVTHREAAPYLPASSPAHRVLYPHESTPAGRRAVALERYPRARAYLLRHAERLRRRTYLARAGREWYELWVPQAPDGWSAPRIVFPDISERPRFFLDRSGAVVNGDCYWLTLREAIDPRLFPLMLAVANSSLAARYYDTVCGNRLYSGRRRFITQYVARFPLPAADTALAARISGLVETRLAPPATAGAARRLEREIDRLVWIALTGSPRTANDR